jgi:hypothetical protein
MASDYDDDQEETYEARPRYCEDCRVLTEALRDMEQQCRETEDGRYRGLSLPSSSSVDVLTREEDAYLARLSKLQRRRDCALEVLLKHQSLEHRERS